MKKKIVSIVLVFIFIMMAFELNVFAIEPNYYFKVWVSRDDVPSGTAYIDMLLPISETNECYVEFNENNGEKFSISPESEIAKYNEQGFVSYTFHVSDAVSQMRPSYDFNVEKSRLTEELQKELAFYDNGYKYYIRAYWNTQTDLDLQNSIEYLNKISKITKEDFSFVSYVYFVGLVEDDDRSAGVNLKYDYMYIAEKYKTAKFAYLDNEGNILSVTDFTPIWEKGMFNLYVHLSGKTAASEFGEGIKMGLMIPYIFVFYLIIPAVIVTSIVLIDKKRKRSVDVGSKKI